MNWVVYGLGVLLVFASAKWFTLFGWRALLGIIGMLIGIMAIFAAGMYWRGI